MTQILNLAAITAALIVLYIENFKIGQILHVEGYRFTSDMESFLIAIILLKIRINILQR